MKLLAAEVTANQACCGLIPRAMTRYFLFLKASSMVNELAQQAVGSAQQNLSQGIVANFATILPPENLLEVFDANMSSFFDKWIANLQESKSLAATRDSLLPKLLSGELNVMDFELATDSH